MSKEKHLILSLTKRDFEFETFRVGGNGGQRRNSTCTGCRYRHRPSGAVGEGREERMQSQNKKAAFERMANSPEMQRWIKAEVARRTASVSEKPETPEDIDAAVKRRFTEDLSNGNIKVEALDASGQWVVIQ
jgi:protein subunit release factor B